MLLLILGCCLPAGLPAPAGTYSCGDVRFTVNALGVLDNGDNLDCGTSLHGDTLLLSCHGFPQWATWRRLPDGGVETDVIGQIYGDGGGLMRCSVK